MRMRDEATPGWLDVLLLLSAGVVVALASACTDGPTEPPPPEDDRITEVVPAPDLEVQP